MNRASTEKTRKGVNAVFRMPMVQTAVSRKSSITNAFVSAIIPAIVPTTEEIIEALAILQIDPTDLRCAYCGDRATEWDHLRPLVQDKRPTGFVSEIANLVPSCGKCNQSKGNKPWRTWILSTAKQSPTGRMCKGTDKRIARLEAFECWREPTVIDFESILGRDEWRQYWALCDAVNEELRRCHETAQAIRSRVRDAMQNTPPSDLDAVSR